MMSFLILLGFAAGLFRQRIYVSRELVENEDGAPMLDVVMAHERAHVTRRDSLRAAIATFALAFHVPRIARRLERKLADAHEAAADEQAARETGSPARVADVIVRLDRA